MKETRKQKLRKKEVRRRSAGDRKYSVAERLLDLNGLKSVFCPLDWMTKADLVTLIKPGFDVEISEESKQDPEMKEIKAALEWVIDRRLSFSLDGEDVEVSLDDIYRGLFGIQEIVKCIWANATARNFPEATLARLGEAKRRIARFREAHLNKVFNKLNDQLNEVADQYLRMDKKVIWYKIEPNNKYPDRHVLRVVLGRSLQLPVSLAVSEGRRKAYPCVRAFLDRGPKHVKWNPAKLGIGSDDRDLPVYVGEHAFARLEERIPVALDITLLHNMLYDSLEFPIICPTEGADGFLVEAGPPTRKLGYFVVEIYADFVFVRTFLFLTMQGTPEAKCLRQKLGLSRKDIEYYKLDNYFTLVCSDLGEDPALRRALAECGCDYLLDLSNSEKRLSWLKRYREPLRRELGLPLEAQLGEAQMAHSSGNIEIERMIDYSQKRLKFMQGWTF
jgi:uncharacterized protein with HEPN domain